MRSRHSAERYLTMRSFGNFSVRPDFCLLIALSLFILPVQWIVGWVLAAAIHELSHILMLRILRIRILSLSLGAGGATITSEPMKPFQELLCALAGPVGGLSALLLLRLMPQVALSAAVQSLYNILPVYPLDGGRALKCAAACIFGEDNAKNVSKIVTIAVIFFLTAAGFLISYRYRLGLLPILFPAVTLTYSVYKNSLQCRENDSTISAYLSNSERTIYR